MRTERDAVFGDASQTFEAHHLIPAAVGKDGPAPGHEAMQATRLANDLVSRPQIEVIGVGKKNLDAQPLEFFLGDSLDAPRGPPRHEGGRLARAVGGVQEPGERACAGVTRYKVECQLARHLIGRLRRLVSAERVPRPPGCRRHPSLASVIPMSVSTAHTPENARKKAVTLGLLARSWTS